MHIQIRPSTIEDFFDLANALEKIEDHSLNFQPFSNQHDFDKYLRILRRKHYNNGETLTGPFTITHNDQPIGLTGIEREITKVYQGKFWFITKNRFFEYKTIYTILTDNLLYAKDFDEIQYVGCICPNHEKDLKKALHKLNFTPAGSPQIISGTKIGLELYIREMI